MPRQGHYKWCILEKFCSLSLSLACSLSLSAARVAEVRIQFCFSFQISQCFQRMQKWLAFSCTCSGDHNPYRGSVLLNWKIASVVRTLRLADPRGKSQSRCWPPPQNETLQKDRLQTKRDNKVFLNSVAPRYAACLLVYQNTNRPTCRLFKEIS